MKLIIDILEENYYFIKSHFRKENVIDMAIVNGKSLPENCGRLMTEADTPENESKK